MKFFKTAIMTVYIVYSGDVDLEASYVDLYFDIFKVYATKEAADLTASNYYLETGNRAHVVQKEVQ